MTAGRPEEILGRDELRSLVQQEATPALSIYLPTERVAVEPENNSLRLKSVLPTAHEALADEGMRRPEIDEMLRPLKELLGDSTFWRHQLEGLVLFRTSDFLRHFRLPFPVPELVVVAERFHIKPLLPAVAGDGHFYILALSQHSVRLFRATRWGVTEIDIDGLGIPRSLEEALRYDDLQEPDSEYSARSPKPPMRQAGMFHGHGPGGEDVKNELLRFFQEVDHGICKILNEDSAPLVLAAVDYLHPIYKRASNYNFIFEQGVEGNPDRASGAQLHEQAWPLIEPHFASELAGAGDRYRSQVGKGLASCRLDEVVVAAQAGRVGWLFLHRDAERWGRYEPARGELEEHEGRLPGDVDLLDLAARETFMTGGKVYVVGADEMPCPEPLAAVYRF